MRKMQHLPSRDNFCSGHSLSAVDSRNTRFHWFLILAFRNSLAPRSVSIFHDSGSSLMSIPLPHGPPDQENLSSLPQHLADGPVVFAKPFSDIRTGLLSPERVPLPDQAHHFPAHIH
jgi:hypothetical protein